MAADLNPGFTFDFGGGGNDDVQAPWEFGGALAQAEKDVGASNATSIDHKIAQQLARNKRPAAGRKAAGGGGRRAAVSDSDDDEGVSGDSEDDAPLPGELDDDDSDDDDEVLEEEEDEEDDGGEERGSAASEDGSQEEDEEGSDDEIARAVMELDSDALEASSEEEEEEEEEEEDKDEEQPSTDEEEDALPTVGKRKRETQQQQQQQQDVEARPRRGPGGEADARRQQESGGEGEGEGKRRKGGYFDAAPSDTQFSAKSFATLGLSRPLVKACEALGYAQPTPIQAACIPLAMAGRDICGSAVTGSGKTAAFGLPVLERLLHRNKRMAATYVLVLTPVRELAVQVHSMIQRLAQFTDIQAALVVGGLSLQAQAATLRAQPEVVVATPGRLIDHLRNTQSVGLEDLAVLVLDEADRLLEMGFAEEIREVVRMAPVRRQTMLFSATMTEEVKKLVALSLKHPVRLAADAAAAAPKELSQEIVRLKGGAAARKEAALLALCSKTLRGGRTIVFAKTKQRAHRLKMLFGLAGLPPAGELHGDMTQAARLESLERFRRGEVAFLLCTELAARGLDILGVETVVNFDAPATLASYLHRVGRTARAGAAGRAVTFIEDGDRALLKEVIKRTGVQMQQRQLTQASVDSWHARVEALQPQVDAIVQEEREERALRRAEMEAQKASNLLEHQDEILARPARTWFQTEKQKREVAQRAKQAAADGGVGGEEGEGEEGDEMSGKQRRNKAKNERRAEQKQQRAVQAREAAKNKSNKLMEETRAASRSIKAVKAKEQQLRLEGVTGGRAGKMAASMVTGVKRKKQKKKARRARWAPTAPAAHAVHAGAPCRLARCRLDAAPAPDLQGKDGGGGAGKHELFDGDGLPAKPASKGGKVYAGGARSGAVRAPRAGGKLGKAELNKVKRGGKGRHGFKSKAKHKRR